MLCECLACNDVGDHRTGSLRLRGRGCSRLCVAKCQKKETSSRKNWLFYKKKRKEIHCRYLRPDKFSQGTNTRFLMILRKHATQSNSGKRIRLMVWYSRKPFCWTKWLRVKSYEKSDYSTKADSIMRLRHRAPRRQESKGVKITSFLWNNNNEMMGVIAGLWNWLEAVG